MREELARALATLSDPRLIAAIVTRVEVADDLQLAKVYVRSEHGADDRAAQKALLRAFESATGRLRREVTRALSLRFSPVMRFYYDDAPDQVLSIEKILQEIKDDEKK
jgi:ribosome-binding factor A